jgi:hypothetical protein
LQAIYLTGERIYLRAMQLSDKDYAAAWFSSLYPINATRAEAFLKDELKDPYSRTQHLAVILKETDEIAGGLTSRTNGRKAVLSFTAAPWAADADRLRADTLRLAIPWMRDEASMLSVIIAMPADETASIAVADELGMRLAVRLREHLARPGHRVDLLLYQVLGPIWTEEEPNHA